MRYHVKPKKCALCGESFGTITHLKRHANSVHNTTKKYYCTVPDCKYSKGVGHTKFISRKDNWRRHMQDKHGKQAEELKDLETDIIEDEQINEMTGEGND